MGGALAMCAALLEASDTISVGLAHFCDHVDIAQTWEIGGMVFWLADHGHTLGTKCLDGSIGCGDLTCDSSKAFFAANAKMHEAMAVEYTCSPQVDFVQA